MYELLLQLPLFQGFSIEQLTQLIETVGMDFQKFKRDETIVDRGRDCAYIRLLISGSIRIETPFSERNVNLVETLTGPQIILPNYLYGWHTTSPSTVSAITEVGILQFSKPTFERLLSAYPVFLINYLNIISFRSQQFHLSLQRDIPTLEERFYSMIELMGHRGSKNVIIESPRAYLADLFGMPRLALFTMLDELEAAGRVKLTRGRIELIK